MRRLQYSALGSGGSSTNRLELGEPKYPSGNALRRIRPSSGRCGLCHTAQSRGVTEQVRQRTPEPRGGQLALLEYERRTRTFECAGVGALMVGGGRRKRHEERRNSPRAELGHRQRAGASEGEIRCSVCTLNGSQVRTHANALGLVTCVSLVAALPRSPDEEYTRGQPGIEQRSNRVVQWPRALTAAEREDDAFAARRKPPRGARIRARRPGRRRWLDRVAAVDQLRVRARMQPRPRLRIPEVNGAGVAREEASGDARNRILLLQLERDAVRERECERGARCVAAGADHGGGRVRAMLSRERLPGAAQAAHRAPALPRLLPIEGMQIEQQMLEFRLGKYVALDATESTNEKGSHLGSLTHERAFYGEPRIQMSARTATGEHHPHRHAGARSSGFVACPPITRSRVLAMFTRMPVIRMDITRFVRPKLTNGSVSPVVGSSPITTHRCRNAVRKVMNVVPIASSC